MGNKESRTPGEKPLEVLYTSTLKTADLLGIHSQLQKQNVHLSTWQAGLEGPVLHIRDGTKESAGNLIGASQRLGDDDLMVALSTKRAVIHNSKLIQLKWDKAYLGLGSKYLNLQSDKNEPCADRIMRFIRDRIKTRAASKTNIGSESAEGIPPLPLAREEIAYVERGDHGAVKDSGRHDVSVVYDRENPDKLMTTDVSNFLREECGIELKPAESSNDSPLLVICKNDTKLQEDIDNAKRRTRTGKDVMLFVVTDRREQRLTDTEATKGFGAKALLLWDHARQKFGGKDNRSSLVWFRTFLEQYGYEVNVKLSRTDSIVRSFKRKEEVKGVYCVLQPVEEELIKNTIVFFDHHLIVMKAGNESDEHVILFCAAGKHAETAIKEFMQGRKDPSDVLIVVLYRSYQTLPNLTDAHRRATVLRLLVSDTRWEILDTAENHKVADPIRGFLKKSRRRTNANQIRDHSKKHHESMSEHHASEPMEEIGLSASGDSTGFSVRETRDSDTVFSVALPREIYADISMTEERTSNGQEVHVVHSGDNRGTRPDIPTSSEPHAYQPAQICFPVQLAPPREFPDTRYISSLAGQKLPVRSPDTQSQFYPDRANSYDSYSTHVSFDSRSAWTEGRPYKTSQSLPGRRKAQQKPAPFSIVPNERGESVFRVLPDRAVGVPMEPDQPSRHAGKKRVAEESLCDLFGDMAIHEEKKPYVEKSRPAPRRRRQGPRRTRR